MKIIEKQLKALANARRLMILKFLKKQNKSSVGDIAKEIKLSFKSTSRHLAVLFSNDIVQREQVNLNMLYSLNSNISKIAKSIISQI